MTKLMILAGVVALVAVPAFATQQTSQKAQRLAPTQPGQMMLFEALNYGGDSYVIDQARTNVRTSWNIRSVGIHPGERWQICARSRYRDPCIVLDRSVHDASLIGVEGQIGSARPAPEGTGD